MTRFVLTAVLILASIAQQTGDKPLTVSFIDVEGGQATLVVSPSGQSLLIGTGFPGFEDRDLGRILAAAKQSGVSRIDYLVITHYPGDHVGNAAALAKKLPIGTFIDHGQPVEPSAQPLYDGYAAAWGSSRHV